ncbi:hypothetical protein [Mucilaginibacter sp.]
MKLVVAIAAICFVYLFAGLWFRPIVSSDAINGMISLLNHLNGSPWNVSYSLSGNGQVVYHPLTWWSPGQYELPYWVTSLFSVNMGTAIIVLLFCSAGGGCYFYIRVFQFSKLSIHTVLFALLFLLLQRFININFIQYSSPDLYLFFFTPFYIFIYFLLASRNSTNSLFMFGILTALNLFGLFIKNSFLLFELAFNIFLLVEYALKLNVRPTGSALGSRKKYFGILVMLPFAAANLLFYFFFLRQGVNPSHGNGWQLTIPALLTGIFTPFIQVLFASLSVSGIYGNIYDKINLSQVVTDVSMLFFMFAAGYFSYARRSRIFNKIKRDRMFRFVTIVSCCYLCFWVFFTLHQSAVSNEDRLFLPVTIFLFPYLLDYTAKSRSTLRYLYFTMVAGSLFYGIFTFAYRTHNYSLNGALNSRSQQLNGFKVLPAQPVDDKDLQKISAFVSLNFKSDYIILPKPEFAFALEMTNRCMVIPVMQAGYPPYMTGQPACLILAERGKGILPDGLKVIFSAGNLLLYRIGPPDRVLKYMNAGNTKAEME